MIHAETMILRLACLMVAGMACPLIAQSTYEQRHDAYYDDISGRKR